MLKNDGSSKVYIIHQGSLIKTIFNFGLFDFDNVFFLIKNYNRIDNTRFLMFVVKFIDEE